MAHQVGGLAAHVRIALLRRQVPLQRDCARLLERQDVKHHWRRIRRHRRRQRGVSGRAARL
eukprot:7388867-Prymnesium_polylepis.1